MNQIFSYARKHGPEYVEKLKTGKKDMTNRELCDYRLKCNIGDKMINYIDCRSKDNEKIPDKSVIKRIIWYSIEIPRNEKRAKRIRSPRKDLTWYEFAIKDGFKNYQDFVKFFILLKNRKDEIIYRAYRTFICFVWNPNEVEP